MSAGMRRLRSGGYYTLGGGTLAGIADVFDSALVWIGPQMRGIARAGTRPSSPPRPADNRRTQRDRTLARLNAILREAPVTHPSAALQAGRDARTFLRRDPVFGRIGVELRLPRGPSRRAVNMERVNQLVNADAFGQQIGRILARRQEPPAWLRKAHLEARLRSVELGIKLEHEVIF